MLYALRGDMAWRRGGSRPGFDPARIGRLGSLRMVLVFLALVPSLALLGLWALSTIQVGADWQRLIKEDHLTRRGAVLAGDVTQQLQEERRLTGRMVATGSEADRRALKAQRRITDDAVRRFRDSTDVDLSELPRQQLRDALRHDRHSLARLDDVRAAADRKTVVDAVAVRTYTELIEANLALFEALGHADNGELAAAFKPLIDLMWADEMLSREDAVLSYSWAAEQFRDSDRPSLSQWIGAQNYLVESEITPRLTDDERSALQNLLGTTAWTTKSMVEEALIARHPTDPELLPWSNSEWRLAMQTLDPRFAALIEQRAHLVQGVADDVEGDLETRLWTYSVLCLGAVIVVITLSVLLTNSLRRRVLGLRDEAARLQTELPGVMERLRSGEDVDIDTEVREVRHGDDELGQLGRALNLARRTAVETAVREAEQHRGFQRMLQRLARRTQLLIGLQLKKLDEMERGQEDPEILEGLYDLDHLTSRLRRYEENLVVLGGGQPQRRWRRPVRVVDVLRAALGEVQDYRRITIEVGEEIWLAGRAVGPLVHIAAELMENAAAFSKPPSPVEARATVAGDGLALEVEDRGLGMDPEGYAAVNAMMAEPPELDVAARAEDARLGLYVVSQLAAGLGLRVEFRPSVYGGTRVIVMVPPELVAERPDDAPEPHTVGDAPRDDKPAVAEAAVTGSGADRPGTAGTGTVAGAEAPAGEPRALPGVLPAGYEAVPEDEGESRQVVPDTGGDPEELDVPSTVVLRRQRRRREHARAEAPEAGPGASAPTTTRPGAGRRAEAGTSGEDAAPRDAGEPPRLPTRSRGRALDPAGARTHPAADGSDGAPRDDARPRRPAADSGTSDRTPVAEGGTPDGAAPLPRRVRQTHLAPGLKEPKRPRRVDDPPPDPEGTQGARSGAAIGAFQRHSRRVHRAAAPAQQPTTGGAAPDDRSDHTEDAP